MLNRALFAIVFSGLLTSGCRTHDAASVVEDDQTPPVSAKFDTPAGVPAPFAKGDASGLFWEARFNLPPCDHPPHKKGVFCTGDDTKAAAAQSGVEDEIKAWANDPKVKSMQLAFFSFSDEAVIQTLCAAANARPVKITVYLHKENIPTPGAQKLATCAPGKLSLVPRGTEFGTGYLAHAKIVLASEFTDPLPLHLMPAAQRTAAGETVTRFTSGSANMSQFGTSLHLDNWLFFTARTKEYLAQENLCFFQAVRTMQNAGDADADRTDFAKKNDACIKGITIPKRTDIVFFPVPHARITRQIFPEVKKMLDGARRDIKVVIHRLTTANVFGPLRDAKRRGVDVKVINDDDTLRTGKCNGGPAVEQGGQDVQANRTLTAAGVPVTYLETNGAIGQLAHNKFIVVDDRILLQGAGNFTATSLNSNSLGNLEDFYIITEPNIVKTYSKAWDILRGLSTRAEDHEVFKNKDKALKSGNFGMELDDSVCTAAP